MSAPTIAYKIISSAGPARMAKNKIDFKRALVAPVKTTCKAKAK